MKNTPIFQITNPVVADKPTIKYPEENHKPLLQFTEPISSTSIPSITEISSPLKGIELEELYEIISNPFDYKGPGRDDGHHGTDFSFYRYKSFEKIENLPIQSMFAGTVSSVIENRPPYGNQIIIETALSKLPQFIQTYLFSSVPETDLPYITNLNCPDMAQLGNFGDQEDYSLYVLYAHLIEPSGKNVSEMIQNGEEIGKVGNTGSSGNPHLHLEFRLGRSGYKFPEMAHYENSATFDEIKNYCLWRVSGYFFPINSLDFINFYLQNR
ncbi:MAG: M23 family metallopeptidase [Anaerolineaceae bacterium]|nr:M23 family metallopeptidase [Anaerolineaceae bacterium]